MLTILGSHKNMEQLAISYIADENRNGYIYLEKIFFVKLKIY